MRHAPRLFGHPIHPMVSSFPLVLWASSSVWDAFALTQGDPTWWALSFRCELLGLVALLPTAVAGMLDLSFVPEGVAAATGRAHMMVMLLATTAYGASALIRRGSGPCSSAQCWEAVGTALFGLVCLGIGGWLGGHLVFHHGVGRTDSSRT